MGDIPKKQCAIDPSEVANISSDSALDQAPGGGDELPPPEFTNTNKEVEEDIATKLTFATAGGAGGSDKLTQNVNDDPESCHDEEEGWGQAPKGENKCSM